MSNEDDTIWVVFNGEIYNHQSLRSKLRQLGHTFHSVSDTEVLVHLYEEYEQGAFSHIRGMFAIAIWDSRRNRLMLGRDRFGKKPLYYATLPGKMYFASELEGLLQAGIPCDVDDEALQPYFKFLYVPERSTGIRLARKLAPGSWMTFTVDGDTDQGRFWQLPTSPDGPSSELNEVRVCHQLKDKFDEAVRVRMTADVPVGAFLSGGIDSSSVVASMSLQSTSPVKTFSQALKTPPSVNLGTRALVANKYHTDHHELIVPEDEARLIGVIERLIVHFGEPFADSSAIPTYLLCELAAQHVKVLLSGDGGDELFAGYEVFGEAQRMHALDYVPRSLRRIIGVISDKLPYSAYGKNYLRMVSLPTPLERYFEHICVPYFLRENALRHEWMLPAEKAYYTESLSDFLLPYGAGLLAQAIHFATTSALVSDMLCKVYCSSMAHALEVRCPFLDHELAELAGSIPNAWKLRNGKGKQIIFQAWGDRFPAELFVRPKMGFAAPVSHWLRGILREYLHDHLESARFVGRDRVSPKFLRELFAEHDSLRRDNSRWLWC